MKQHHKPTNFLELTGAKQLSKNSDLHKIDQPKRTNDVISSERAVTKIAHDTSSKTEEDRDVRNTAHTNVHASHSTHLGPRVLSSHPTPPHSSRSSLLAPRSSHTGRWIFLGIVIFVLALTLPAAIGLTRAAFAAEDAKTAVKKLQVDVSSRDFDAAGADLDRISNDLLTARSGLRATGFWRSVPWIGSNISALDSAATAGIQVVDGGKALVLAAGNILGTAQNAQDALGGISTPPDLSVSFGDMSPDQKREILARLDRAIPDLKAAQVKIDIATESWNRIPQNDLLPPLRAALAPVADTLPRLQQSIDEALPLLQVFLPLIGYPKPANYLVLLQNQDEIRATGGFIGTIGNMSVDAGNLTQSSFQDIYAVDNPASGKWKEVPPAPIKDRLGVPAWFLRDANWSPDFPTSAEKVMDFYVREIQAGTGKAPTVPNGVIAINPPVFTELMHIAGPIQVDGTTYDEKNYLDLLEYQVEVGFLKQGIPRDNRKDTLTKLGAELIKRLSSLPASRWSDLLDLATTALDQKQMMVYVRDPDTLSQLDVNGWTGRVLPTNGDYLWVVDSNLAALKTDGVMDKSVTYKLDATDPNHPKATVTLQYTNRAPGLSLQDQTNFKYTRYRSYTRVYVPDGAKLISSNGAMKDDRYRTGGRFVDGTVDVYHELGKTVFGAFWSIEPKTSQSLSLTYELPPSVVATGGNGPYTLDWQKQSGNDHSALTLDLLFGKKVERATPPEAESEWGDNSYRVSTDSMADRHFEVTLGH